MQCQLVPGPVLCLGLSFSSAAFCCCFPSVLGFVFGLLALCFPVLSPCFHLYWIFSFFPPYFFSLKRNYGTLEDLLRLLKFLNPSLCHDP